MEKNNLWILFSFLPRKNKFKKLFILANFWIFLKEAELFETEKSKYNYQTSKYNPLVKYNLTKEIFFD